MAGARVLHLYPCEKGTGGLVQALAPELPVVLSLMHLPEHDLGLWQREIDAAARILVPGRTLLVRLADRLRLDPARVRIVEPGLPYGSELTSRSARTWAGEGPLRILHLGERGPDSGFEDLLAAIAMLEKDQVQLCCFGQPGRGAAPALRPAALQVTLGDRLDTQAIATLARSCHLAAFPMRRELGYTLVAEEALALGLPVLASHCDGVVERHGSGAIEVLPAGDVPAWARALRHHLSDPADLALAQAALPGTIADAAGVATRLHALYGEILATRAA
ncbi:MAG: glycosyltransferase [Planctomycetota bacterium]